MFLSEQGIILALHKEKRNSDATIYKKASVIIQMKIVNSELNNNI